MEPVKIIIIGAGGRGFVYAQYALDHPDKCRVVGVAEPREFARNQMTEMHGIAPCYAVSDWKTLEVLPKFADAVVIAAQESVHVEPSIAFAEKGYGILLEKPLAPDEEECRKLYLGVKDIPNLIFSVCHVLRYTAYTQTIKKMIDDGRLGEIVSVNHLEPTNYWYFCHNYVRGYWNNENRSSPMLLVKCCHDMDWLSYIIGAKCMQIQSFGNLHFFHSENMPADAADRCMDCPIEEKCPYSAYDAYIRRNIDQGNTGWPLTMLAPDVSRDSIMNALKEGPYGRCVFACDNNVCDQQTVNMLFEQGQTATFTVTAFTSPLTGRRTTIFGTAGELRGDSRYIHIYDYLTDQTETIDISESEMQVNGDVALMDNFVDAVRHNDPNRIISGIDESYDSHLMVFDAEKSRKEQKLVFRG